MPLPGWLARFNRSVTNHATRPLMGVLRSGAVVVHCGRRSGHEYRTPVLAFEDASEDGNRGDGQDGRGFVIALTYGDQVDWLKNVMAAGGCRLEVHGNFADLVDPVLVHGPKALAAMPGRIRWVLGRLGVTDTVRLRRRPGSPT